MQLDSVLSALPPASLRAVAAYHRQMAARCMAQARRLEKREREQRAAERRLDRLGMLPQLVAVAMAGGAEIGAAVRLASQKSGVPVATVELYITRERRRQEQAARERREAEILRLARAGWTNGEIAARLDCSRSTVSRAVTRHFRKR